MGGDLTGEEVILEVHNINSREQVHNVIGSLVGDEEPGNDELELEQSSEN